MVSSLFGYGLLLGLFNLNLDTSTLSTYLLYGGLAFVVYLMVSRFAGGESVSQSLTALPDRLGKLLTHVDSLGLPLLKPLLLDAAAGKWSAIPGHILQLLNTLDDKESRRGVLATLFWSRVDHWIADDERTKELLDYLAKKKGLVITKELPAVTLQQVAEPLKPAA